MSWDGSPGPSVRRFPKICVIQIEGCAGNGVSILRASIISTPALRNSDGPGDPSYGTHRLWVDSVGAFLVCLGSQVRIGGPSRTAAESAEISLMSSLSRYHARILRSGEVWLLEPLGPTSINGQPVAKHRLLQDGDSIRLGESVELRFRLPSTLSGTARLDFESDHKTQPAVDGVILFAETCVMGSEADAHIAGPAGSDRVILIRRPTGLWCKAVAGIQVAGVDRGTEVACEAGQVYAGEGWCFRLE